MEKGVKLIEMFLQGKADRLTYTVHVSQFTLMLGVSRKDDSFLIQSNYLQHMTQSLNSPSPE